MSILQEVLLLILIIADICITAIGTLIMVGDYYQKTDVFRVHKKMFDYLRNQKELNLFGTFLPIVIITPVLINAMGLTIIFIISAFITRGVVNAYCKIFKRKNV